jgi:hypothetical protein
MNAWFPVANFCRDKLQSLMMESSAWPAHLPTTFYSGRERSLTQFLELVAD